MLRYETIQKYVSMWWRLQCSVITVLSHIFAQFLLCIINFVKISYNLRARYKIYFAPLEFILCI